MQTILQLRELADNFDKICTYENRLLKMKKGVIVLWGTERIYAIRIEEEMKKRELWKITGNGKFTVLITDNFINQSKRLAEYSDVVSMEAPDSLFEEKKVQSKKRVVEPVDDLEGLLQ